MTGVDDACVAAAGEDDEAFVCIVETYVSRSNQDFGIVRPYLSDCT